MCFVLGNFFDFPPHMAMQQNNFQVPMVPGGMPMQPGNVAFPMQRINPQQLPPGFNPHVMMNIKGEGWQQPPPQQPPFHYMNVPSQKPGGDTTVDVEPGLINNKFPLPDGLIEKLPSSKTPVIDAFIYCAICNWGVSLTPTPDTFVINDFNKYWDYSQKICSKPSPTETPGARLKALRRWFAEFPGIKKIKVVKDGKEPINVKVKPERINDVITIVKKYSQIINTRCRSFPSQPPMNPGSGYPVGDPNVQ